MIIRSPPRPAPRAPACRPAARSPCCHQPQAPRCHAPARRKAQQCPPAVTSWAEKPTAVLPSYPQPIPSPSAYTAAVTSKPQAIAHQYEYSPRPRHARAPRRPQPIPTPRPARDARVEGPRWRSTGVRGGRPYLVRVGSLNSDRARQPISLIRGKALACTVLSEFAVGQASVVCELPVMG